MIKGRSKLDGIKKSAALEKDIRGGGVNGNTTIYLLTSDTQQEPTLFEGTPSFATILRNIKLHR